MIVCLHGWGIVMRYGNPLALGWAINYVLDNQWERVDGELQINLTIYLKLVINHNRLAHKKNMENMDDIVLHGWKMWQVLANPCSWMKNVISSSKPFALGWKLWQVLANLLFLDERSIMDYITWWVTWVVSHPLAQVGYYS